MQNKVAIISHCNYCPESLRKIAVKLGQLLAQKNITIMSDGFGGIINEVFKGAKSKGGTTIALLDKGNDTSSAKFCDIITFSGKNENKSIALAKKTIGAITIDKDIKVEKLHDFIINNKKVIVLTPYNSIKKTSLPEVRHTNSIDSVINIICQLCN